MVSIYSAIAKHALPPLHHRRSLIMEKRFATSSTKEPARPSLVAIAGFTDVHSAIAVIIVLAPAQHHNHEP